MSVSELIKTALPLSAPQSELNFANSVGNGTPIKSANATTPLRARNSQAPPGTPGVATNELSSILKGKILPKCPDEFYKDLQQFHERRGTPCTHLPKISGRVIDLHTLYSEVTERGGFAKVNIRDEWDEILPALGLKDKCVNASAAIKHFYRRYLDKYERLYFFGEDPDKVDAADVSDSNDGGRSRRFFPSVLSGGSSVNAVPMSYNYRQHIVNMDRRRTYKMSLDLHKPSPYEKLILSLLSPLPNEQDFAINVCTLMANENKHTLRLNECPKLLDVLLSHAGVFADFTLRKLLQDVYKDVRRHSLLGFWRDLLHDKPQILELFNSEQMIREDVITDEPEDIDMEKSNSALKDCLDMDFLNLGRGEGTQDYVGQRVQQILAILHNLSFFDENIQVLGKNRTFLRFIVMSANIRWGNIHNQALDIAGNVASELELLDPTSDELSRSLMATLCDGVEGQDRAVIINSLEILYKLSNKDSNEDHIHKCLNLKFYQTICMFLSLNDIMLLIYTLEAIYALSSMGARSCHLIMQVRGVVDQLVSLITVEAQSYGPDGCILMRVVETVPGNMLPMVAQNIANLQNVAVIQKQQHIPNVPAVMHHEQPQLPIVDTQQPLQHQPLPLQTGTQEDEQYALSWLGATFERASTLDSRVEQQELYRMYLSHCQKSGKHSVVTHNQFPRLVRLIFSNNVGPVVVKRTDGTELPGFYYVAIRLRAQPLPVQVKVIPTPQKSMDGKLAKVEIVSARKLKKKPKTDSLDPKSQLEISNVSARQDIENITTIIGATTNQNQVQDNATHPITISQNTSVSVVDSTKTTESVQVSETHTETSSNTPEEATNTSHVVPTTSEPVSTMHISQTNQSVTPQLVASSTASQPSSSLIKSLLANKVTQRQQKQKELIASTTSVQTMARTNVISTTAQPSPIKVASTSISALVNNPLMQNTPLKVGQTTIKPLNTQSTMDKKHMMESAPPPLAPLSGGNASMTKDTSGRPVIIANQMLVEILDKKSTDPTMTGGLVKRKLDDSYGSSSGDSSKRMAIDISGKEETQVTPSKNAANLYAEMAASILEDEDLEDIPLMPTIKPQETHTQQPLMIPAKIQPAPMQNVQRQLLFQSNQGPQLKLTQAGNIGGTTQHIPTAMATIKTDQGLQTVPVILQQKPMEQQQPQLIQQVIQTQVPQQQQQTQYVLATNPQGQTYLVAQQSQAPTPPPQPTQTVLVTQTPQQQSAGTKTIIILQQQTVPSTQQQMMTSSSGGQKMIMTTPQGQQVLVTQRQPTTISSQSQQQIFINPQTGAATHIQHVPVSSVNTSIQQTNANLLQRQLIQTSGCTAQQTGQISPSLLSQLNHIPATIKIHNPNVQMASSNVQTTGQQQHQLNTATLSRLGKSVSIVQTTPSLPPAGSIQIPQLQQHQSIIQQHIVSGPTEKRQVIVGGRTIEIKETVITQTQPPPQHSQLNSQTIITTQPPPQQQQMRSITQQQQQHHPSIIQQKITVPVQQPQLMTAPKVSESMPSLIQSTVKYTTQPQQPTQISLQTPTQATVTTIKKPTAQLQQTPMLAKQQQLPVQSNVQAHNVAQTPTKPYITSRPSTPSSVATTAHVEANSSMATTTTATSESQQQQQQSNTLKANTETKLEEKPSVTTKANVSTATVAHPVQPPIDPNWLYICDWRNCPRRKFKSIQDLHHHACLAHCPDHLEAGAEIFCQWGPGPGLCDGIPRKRFSLMTHILDRHLTPENLRAAVQRRIQTGANNAQPTQPPVTIVRNVDPSQRGSTASPALSTSSSSSLPSTGSSAIHAIKRHTADFVNPKELMDENEGPVTKSIRLTAALILRNLVTYTTTAKRNLRRYEAHLANVALSNVESSATISHILFELNN